MTTKMSVTSVPINSFVMHAGIILDGFDSDGNLFRGEVITGTGESTENELDSCADGEAALGILTDFPAHYQIDLDTANSTAATVCYYAVCQGGSIVYGFHDSAATDALVMGAVLWVAGVGGKLSLEADYEIDFVGKCMETSTGSTTVYNIIRLIV